MDKFPDVPWDSPKESYDKLRLLITNDEYSIFEKRAIFTAQQISSFLNTDIQNVHWTSRPGDIERATGYNVSQQDDASDIVIEHNGYTGISLKVSDKKSKHVPIANVGLGTCDELMGISNEHLVTSTREMLKTLYPELQATSKLERKSFVKSDIAIRKATNTLNLKMLNEITRNYYDLYSGMNKKELITHLKHNLLRARETVFPHIRVTTLGIKDFSTIILSPATYYDPILNDYDNITIEHVGTTITFKYKGKRFIKHRFKMETTSDPLSSIKSSIE